MIQNTSITIVRTCAADAETTPEDLKIVSGETDNLSFGAEDVPLDSEAKQAYCKIIQIQPTTFNTLQKIGTASLNRQRNHMHHRGVFSFRLKRTYRVAEPHPS